MSCLRFPHRYLDLSLRIFAVGTMLIVTWQILRHSRWYYGQTYSVISPSWAESDDQLELTWMRWSEQESFKR